MTAKCASVYNVEVLRFTKIDSCGRPIYGPASTLVIDCFETIQINPDIEDGEEISRVSANGDICIYLPGKKQDRGFEVIANVIKWYPNLPTMLNPNYLQAIDELGNITGYQHVPNISLTAGVAIEGWESVAGIPCADDVDGNWKYFLLPYVVNWAPGDKEKGNTAAADEWNGHTIAGTAWGTGPYNVRRNASTLVAGKLQSALTTDAHQYDELVTLAPPVASCESQPLSNPAGPALALTTCTPASMAPSITATATGGRSMQVNWGDGTSPASITSATPTTHTYTNPGRYVISVKYTDAAQEESYLVVTVPCP
jgi:hypothetical protein